MGRLFLRVRRVSLFRGDGMLINLVVEADDFSFRYNEVDILMVYGFNNPDAFKQCSKIRRMLYAAHQGEDYDSEWVRKINDGVKFHDIPGWFTMYYNKYDHRKIYMESHNISKHLIVHHMNMRDVVLPQPHMLAVYWEKQPVQPLSIGWGPGHDALGFDWEMQVSGYSRSTGGGTYFYEFSPESMSKTTFNNTKTEPATLDHDFIGGA